LVAPTLTIALLGAVESLLCVRIADKLIDDRHDPNQELMAQGVANSSLLSSEASPRPARLRAP